jgi:phosphoribosylformimino-5-aminoimidazole carboxamide ribotide isomerase
MVERNQDSGPGQSEFALLPAIDLRGGRVVRLLRGDFAAETVYGDDPVAVAERFVADGAQWLHVVDLDGARDPAARQVGVVTAIAARVGRQAVVEVAGGLRDEASVEAILAAGAGRVVVGTAALRDPAFAGRLAARFGSPRVVVALDVRDGLAVGHGWVPGASGAPVGDALARLADQGIEVFEVTAIDRDGTLAGPDLDLLERLVALGRGAIIASAGVASLRDLAAVQAAGCAGAIVGRAIYEGRFSVADALTATATTTVEAATGRPATSTGPLTGQQ